MPTYDIQNKKTGEVKEIFCSYNDKEKVLKQEGKDWEYIILGAARISHDTMHPIKRVGTEWNDVLKKIKKNAGRQSDIDHY